MPLQIGLDRGAAGARRIAVDQRWGRVAVVAPPATAARVVLSAPASNLTFRALTFPFTDRRRLEAMIAQELELSLGFPPGQAAWDFVASAGGEVFVVACASSSVSTLLADDTPPRPSTVDAEPYAFQRVLALAGVTDALVADFGARHTTFCRIRGGHLDYVRVLLRGGDDLDALVGRQRALSGPELARRLKHEKGLALAEVAGFIERLLSDALLPPEESTVPLFITGGGARLEGLGPWLESKLGRPVRRMPVPEGVDPDLDVVAFGMALWGLRGGEGVNLHSTHDKKSLVPVVAALLAIMVALTSLDLGVRRAALSRELARNQEAVRTIARTAGNVSSLAELESVLQARSGGASGTGHNLESLMVTLSGAVTKARDAEKAGDLKIEEIAVSANEVRLRGSAAAYPAVESLKNALAAQFGDVNVSSNQLPPEPGQPTARQGFTMVAPLTGPAAGGTPP
ncbi:MAG: hypothetical protein EB084_14005 [Proteobacteria bacterium]|nr:hypothetical protein [Pseudomonadota bacterium]